MLRSVAVLALLLAVPSHAELQGCCDAVARGDAEPRSEPLAVRRASASPRAAAEQQQRPTQRLAWLSGCWERRTARGAVTEQWMAPAGGMMLGASRTLRGDSVVEWEQLRVYERRDTVVYHAMPSGQQPAEFRTTTVSDTLVAFENLAHDFPQRVLYRRAADSLLARIEGMRNGQLRGIDFRYARVPCIPAPASTVSR